MKNCIATLCLAFLISCSIAQSNTAIEDRLKAKTNNVAKRQDALGKAAMLKTVKRDLSKISVYPNPASDWVNVCAEVNSLMEIYDVKGQLVKSNFIEECETVNMIDWRMGIYHIVITNDRGMSSRILIKSPE